MSVYPPDIFLLSCSCLCPFGSVTAKIRNFSVIVATKPKINKTYCLKKNVRKMYTTNKIHNSVYPFYPNNKSNNSAQLFATGSLIFKLDIGFKKEVSPYTNLFICSFSSFASSGLKNAVCLLPAAVSCA